MNIISGATSNHKFVKLFRVNGTEVLFRKTCEMVEGKQHLSIQVHCYFDEFIPSEKNL